MKGGVLTHKRDERDWRLRRFRDRDDNHPIDPNWETGSYSRCHEDARAAIIPGVMIFDAVYVDGKGVVRSALQITHADGQGADRILYFSKFWYPGHPARPVVALNSIRSTRYPEKRTEEEVESLISEMRAAGYVEYESGRMPLNVDPADWNAMVEAGRRARGRPHRCS